jgi:hypothetical protein
MRCDLPCNMVAIILAISIACLLNVLQVRMSNLYILRQRVIFPCPSPPPIIFDPALPRIPTNVRN